MKLLSSLALLLVTLLGLINLTSACLEVNFVYDNNNQRIAWLVVHDNGVFVMSLGASNFPRRANMQQQLKEQVPEWFGSLRNDGRENWSVAFETPSGLNIAFALDKRCTSPSETGCQIWWMSKSMFC